jgi:hypothetical protein
MDMSSKSIYACLFLLLIATLCHSQTGISLTQPNLIAVTPVNSTALNVTWQFAPTNYDQSDLIRVYINFYEFFFNYGPMNTSVNYVFTTANKTITSLIKNFQLVNAFYYVCLSSNSTLTNYTQFLFVQTCQLKRTCSRANSSVCPQTGFIVVSTTTVSANSFTITVNWLNNLPYNRNTTNAQLIPNGAQGTLLTQSINTTYTSLPYQFTGLQPQTIYTVNIIVNYALFGHSLTDTMNYIVTTSRSSNLVSTGNISIFIAWSVLLSVLFS